MANLGQTFNAAEIPVSDNYEPLPAGWYSAVIKQSELRDTAAGDGQYIKVRYDIVGPTHEGRVVFGNINIRNKSATAEQIGRQQLGELMRALGIPIVTDSDQLIGGTVLIKLEVRPERADERTGRIYSASNEVKGFRSLSALGAASAPSHTQTSTAAPQAAVAATNGSAARSKANPPWIKRAS